MTIDTLITRLQHLRDKVGGESAVTIGGADCDSLKLVATVEWEDDEPAATVDIVTE